MINFRKSLIASAVLAAALIAALGMKPSSAEQEASPASAVASRFPAVTETLVAENIGRPAPRAARTVEPAAAERAAPASCVHEHWPYVADECLVAADGAQMKKPTRVIRIERRVADTKLVAVN